MFFSPCRTDGGIAKGSTIGILLDFSRGIIIFLINDEQQGPVAFEGLEGVYYPAISINRNVQVRTLDDDAQHGRDNAPSDFDDFLLNLGRMIL